MKRFNISERDIPAGSIILNKPVSLFEKYRAQVVIAIIIFGLLCGIILILVFHIREQRKAKETLQENQELFSLFMKHSPIYTYIKEVTPSDSHVLQASDNFHQMVGVSARTMVGKSMAELFPPEFAAKLIADDWAVVFKGDVLRLEEELHGRTYTTIKFPIVLREKTLLAGYTIDITERKQAEEVLRKAKEDAEMASNAKSEFLNNIAHDFRTPMHAIMGFSGFLQSENLTVKQKKFADIINERSQALLKLVEDLLDVSRLDAGRLELRSMEFDPKECVRTAVALAKVELMSKDVQMVCFIDESIPQVKGDEVRFNQILTNLVSNAVKYTDRGEIVVNITREECAQLKDKCRIRVSVKDTGLGIPQDKLTQIFDAFSRFHEFTGGKERGGVGLGLYITKTLVGLMKGEIGVVSEESKGSEFVVMLDLDTVEL